jgi:hypothetical protein
MFRLEDLPTFAAAIEAYRQNNPGLLMQRACDLDGSSINPVVLAITTNFLTDNRKPYVLFEHEPAANVHEMFLLHW